MRAFSLTKIMSNAPKSVRESLARADREDARERRTRIMLVYPPLGSQARTQKTPPLGLMFIASYLLGRETNVEIKILDYAISPFTNEGFMKELMTFAPHIVGMSVLTLNSFRANVIAKLAKQYNPEILVVVGGVHATFLTETCLEYGDIVVRGEGEETFWEIVHGYPLDSILGISYWKDGEILHNPDRPFIRDIETLQPAGKVFNLLETPKYENWGIMGSRGCPHACIFCSSPRMWQKRLRVRSAKSIVDEIVYLHTRLGIRSIMFFDDTLNVPQKRAFEICDEIIKRELNKEIAFACQLRANAPNVSPELFKRMKEANFLRVEFGIESGSQYVLDSINKVLTIEEARRAPTLAKEQGIQRIVGFFLIGNWNETLLDVVETWLFILRTPVYPLFSIVTPFPGTKIYSMLKQQGLLKEPICWDLMNQHTVISRTNKMSKPLILLLYAISILFFHSLIAFTRGRSIGATVKGIKRLLSNS